MPSFSYSDLLKLIPKAQPRKFPEPRCDPILEHCIKLRKFYNEIDNLVLLTANLKEIYEDSEREPILKALPPVPELPEFIKDKISDENMKNLELEKIELSGDTITKLVSKAIVRVMFVLGYTVVPSHLLQKISKMIVDYVKSLSEMIVNQMSEDGSVSADLLEAALQQKGIRGIEELHSFYTQRIKFQDGLYMKCKHLCEVLKNNLKKPDAPLKQNINESPPDEKCSADAIKGVNIETEIRNRINRKDSYGPKIDSDQIESPEKNLFHSDILAEDLFANRKFKQKTVHLANETGNRDEINHKDSNELKIDSDQRKFPEKNTLSSECFSNPESVLIEGTDCLKRTKTSSNLSDESSQAVSENGCKVTDDLLRGSIYYSYDKPSDCAINDVTNECLVSDEKGSSYFENKLFLSDRNSTDGRKVLTIFDEEMVSDEAAIDSKLINKSSDLSESNVTNEEKTTYHNVIAKSYSKPENLFSENTSLECTKYNSDSSSEPYVAVSNGKKIYSKKVKRKSIESLDDSPIGNRNKRLRLKHERLAKKDVGMGKVSPKIRSNLKKYSKSNSNCDKLQENGTASEKNSFNYHNSELNSGFEVCSDDGIIKTMTEESSSSENETEQMWLSL